jgi:hypothetical protein
MTDEETSVSSSSEDEQTKSALSPSTPLPESVEGKKASNDKGNGPTSSGKESRNSTPINKADYSGKKKRKRKQRSKSEDERELLELQKERYDRLIFTARKQLHKTAKQIKTFLLQKEIRKRTSKSNQKEGGENAVAPTGLDAKKSLDLEVVTSQALRQLGLYHCDPRFKMATEEMIQKDGPTNLEESKAEETNEGKERNDKKKGGKSKKNMNKDDNTPPVIPNPLAPDDPKKPLVDAVLTHKRFLKALEEWNEKITEYRRWCMKLEQRNNPNPFGMDDDFVVSKRSKKGKNTKKQGSTVISDVGLQATVENESSLFCTLGDEIVAGSNVTDEFNRYSQYGPASNLTEAPKRKNRKGQRQRRAKALAIEAKKQGRSHEYYQSSNWREPKPKNGKDDTIDPNGEGHRTSRGRGKEKNRNHRPKRQQQQNWHNDQSSSGEPQQEQNNNHKSHAEEKQHPSWAAKQAQSTGIVAFKGTKISF